jgi:hypothetical protein
MGEELDLNSVIDYLLRQKQEIVLQIDEMEQLENERALRSRVRHGRSRCAPHDPGAEKGFGRAYSSPARPKR